jgi:hypothetical protein
VATCVVSCTALVTAGAGAADVATMGTTITSGTVIAAKTLSLGARALNWGKGLVGKGNITVYRSMSQAELDGIVQTKSFDEGYNMSGKWFADDLSGAEQWANMPGNERIISITIPRSVFNAAEYRPKLNNIGPAHYFEVDNLNASYINITVVK